MAKFIIYNKYIKEMPFWISDFFQIKDLLKSCFKGLPPNSIPPEISKIDKKKKVST